MASYGGWAGKTLRVDLSTGKITAEDTIERYKDYLGGTGVAYKVLWDEVPSGTKGFDEANKLMFGVGPLTGSGAVCAGRVTITGIFPSVYPTELVGSGHMGGHWGAELKFAGWDNIIVEGKAEKPVWISILDDKVEIRDASRLWGNGIYRATAEVCQEIGADAQVAAIGQAGENQVRMATIMNGYSHSAGGLGGVMGSKNLKAIGVRGTGAVRIAADQTKWLDYVKYVNSILGANNQHSVPSTPQPWAEYYSSGSRWTARTGLFWGAADPPVETGICAAQDQHRIGYRTMKAIMDLGPQAEKYTVRMGGCHSCPIRCHSHVDVPSVEQKYGLPRYAANTCTGWPGSGYFNSAKYPDGPQGQTFIEAQIVGKHMHDDYGIWNNYGLLQRDFRFAYENGIIKAKLSKQEYDSIPWAKLENGDPSFLQDICKRIAFKTGELGTLLGEGSGRMAAKWDFPQEYFDDHSVVHWKMGHPKHHSTENGGQVGLLVNLIYNRDAQNHSHSNLSGNGLPIKVQKAIGEKLFGSGDAIDANNNYTPMNRYKAVFAKWAVLRKELHDSLTLCQWMYPLSGSPLKERGYIGDDGAEAGQYSLVTGDEKSKEELDQVAERIFNLHRALTIRDMGTKEMRAEHDTVPPWVFDYPADKAPFTSGHAKMDPADIETAKDLFYAELGWDTKTGSPTRQTYDRLGLGYVADGLAKLGLL